MSPKRSKKPSKQLQAEVEQPVKLEESSSGEEEEISGSDNNSSVEESEPRKKKTDSKAGGGGKERSKKKRKCRKIFWFRAFFNIIRLHGKDSSISMAELKKKFFEHLSERGTPTEREETEWAKALRLMEKNESYRMINNRVEVLDRKTGQKVVFVKY